MGRRSRDAKADVEDGKLAGVAGVIGRGFRPSKTCALAAVVS
jgi:hypothetical protein